MQVFETASDFTLYTHTADWLRAQYLALPEEKQKAWKALMEDKYDDDELDATSMVISYLAM